MRIKNLALFGFLAFASTAMAALPDLKANLAHGQCANGPGNAGADSYFVGKFNFAGDKITGDEAWILFANPKWVQAGGNDCELHWTITGTRTKDIGACQGCSEGMTFHAEPIMSSNCPAALVQGHKAPTGETVGGEGVPFDQKYAIQKGQNGTVKVYFAKSGKLLGEGYQDATGLTYVSAHSCRWF